MPADAPVQEAADSRALAPSSVQALASYESGDALLLTRTVATETCPHCARRPATVETHLRLPGRMKHPKRLIAFGALGSLAAISLLPTVLLLAWYARHDERSMELKVRLCRACEEELRRAIRRDDRLYFGAAGLPAAVFLAGAALAAITGATFPLVTLVTAELTAFVIAGVAFARLGERRRKRLPYLLASDGSGGWRARLPGTWRQVLEKEGTGGVRLLEP